MEPVALGFRAHSGWAALIAVGGVPANPVVLDRRRLELADRKQAGSLQPYHAAEEAKTPREAARLIQRFEESARRLAVAGLAAVSGDLEKKGCRPIGAGILLASGRPLPGLDGILASHALIHTADGEHFRAALAGACEGAGLSVLRVRERELPSQAEEALGRPAGELSSVIATMGRSLGPPWTQDQKLATLIAWLTLATIARRGGPWGGAHRRGGSKAPETTGRKRRMDSKP